MRRTAPVARPLTIMVTAWCGVVLLATGCSSPGRHLPKASPTTTVTTPTSATQISTSTPLLLSGLGPLSFGLTLDQARAAVGLGLEVRPGGTPACEEMSFAGEPTGLSLYLLDGRFSVAVLHGPTKMRSVDGITIGSTVAEVRTAFASGLWIGQVKEPGWDRDLLYRSTDPSTTAYEIAASSATGRVVEVRAGARDAVEAYEFCS